jgi:hypothetical protein
MADRNRPYKQLLKRYNLSDVEVGQMFGYPNPDSWRNSSAKERLESQVISIVEVIEKRIIDKITS